MAPEIAGLDPVLVSASIASFAFGFATSSMKFLINASRTIQHLEDKVNSLLKKTDELSKKIEQLNERTNFLEVEFASVKTKIDMMCRDRYRNGKIDRGG